MDKRAIIGIALSILVLVIYQQVVTYFYGPPPTGSAPEAEKAKPEAVTQPGQSTQPSQSAAPASPVPGEPAPGAVSRAASAKEITVDTDNYTAVFTTQGARLKSFKFKKYRSSV